MSKFKGLSAPNVEKRTGTQEHNLPISWIFGIFPPPADEAEAVVVAACAAAAVEAETVVAALMADAEEPADSVLGGLKKNGEKNNLFLFLCSNSSM